MKRKNFIYILLFACIIKAYSEEMADLSVADFSLIHEPTGKIFSFYDFPERFFEIIGVPQEMKLNEHIENDQFKIWYVKNDMKFKHVYAEGEISHYDILLDNFTINRLYVKKDFKTIRGIGIGSSLEEVLDKYDNYNYSDSEYDLFSNSTEDKKSVFFVCILNNYGMASNFLYNRSLYYIIDFKLDKNKKVSSIGFQVIPFEK